MSAIAKNIVFAAIDELNEMKESGPDLEKSETTFLLHTKSSIDSLALVRLLLSVEQLVEDELDQSITVVNEDAFGAEESPFETVGNLITHIENLISG